jgi:hypothetical protein
LDFEAALAPAAAGAAFAGTFVVRGFLATGFFAGASLFLDLAGSFRFGGIVWYTFYNKANLNNK